MQEVDVKMSASIITSKLYYHQKDGCEHDRKPNGGQCGKICYDCVEETIKHIQEQLHSAQTLNRMHLEALRRVSEALGDPFKGDMSRTCLDLGREVKRQLGLIKTTEDVQECIHIHSWACEPGKSIERCHCGAERQPSW